MRTNERSIDERVCCNLNTAVRIELPTFYERFMRVPRIIAVVRYISLRYEEHSCNVSWSSTIGTVLEYLEYARLMFRVLMACKSAGDQIHIRVRRPEGI